ncbi:MAG: response regulator [Limisphaerales bacterium]
MTRNRILIIEDNVLNLELATDLLEANGFVVHQAPTAEEGLRMAREILPDLVLMDFGLPGMDGLSATRNLKANPATRHVAVLGLTAHAMKGDAETALEAGCDGYLTKPIDTRTFIATIRRFIEAATLRQTTQSPPEKETMPNDLQAAQPLTTGTTRAPGFVLVVDDEEQNRCLLRDPLEAHGYEVDEAENGMQALEKIAARLPDVILLDLMMPQMNGFDVCRHLRKNAKTAHLPILMITALSERGDRLLGIQVGANDFLNKPIDIQDVILRVGNAVYAKHLHDQLLAEQATSERLLLNILPKPIAERMKKGETNIADIYPDATVLVADLVGFTTLSAHIDPGQIVQLLNEVFSAFDILVEDHGLEKIKTVGDAYLVAGGVSVPRPDHAEAGAALAIRLREEIARLNDQYGTSIRLRTGISTGPVVAGVIGRKKFAYDLWGETVNLAFHLEATGEAGKIQIAESTYERLKDKYQFEPIHRIDAKGYGDLSAYWLGDRVGNPAVIGKDEKLAS